MTRLTHARTSARGVDGGGTPFAYRRSGLPQAAGFWVVAGVFVLLLFAAAAPSPLYGVYQAHWRFSAITLTAVFAVYALLLLVTLLVFGSVSDFVGRRQVILVSLAMSAGACGLFLAAHGVGLLFAARALQGAAVGTASSAAGAALIDLQPPGSGRAPVVTTAASLLGLGAGGLATSGAGPVRGGARASGRWLLLGASLAAAVAVLAMRETAPRRRGVLASLRPRVAVPRQARATFAMALPCLSRVDAQRVLPVAAAVAGGAGVGSADLVWGGLVIFLLAGIGAAGPVVFRGVSGPAAMLTGCLGLIAGAVVTLAAIELTSAAAFLAGTAVAGVARDSHAGRLSHLTAGRAAGERPAGRRVLHRVLPGIQCPGRGRRDATTHFGLHRTALVYCAAIAALAAVAAAGLLFRARRGRYAATGCAARPGACDEGRGQRRLRGRAQPACSGRDHAA